MSIRNKLAITMVAFLAPMVFASTATAQGGAGVGCDTITVGVCGLGGQVRGQIGDGLPLPISIAPAGGLSATGMAANGTPPWLDQPQYKFIKTTPRFYLPTTQTTGGDPGLGFSNYGGLGFVGKGLGQQGQLKPSASATIRQGAGPGPRDLTHGPTTGAPATSLAPGVFHYGGQPQGSIGVVNFNVAVFAVQTLLTYDRPHPGFTKLGAAAITQQSSGPIPSGAAANKFSAGGRPGAAIVSFYADATLNGTAGTNFGNTIPPGPSTIITPMAGETAGGIPPINGLMRYSAIDDQFGGLSIGRALGTAKVYFNDIKLDPAKALPCKVTPTGPGDGTSAQGTFVPFIAGTACQFALSIVDLTMSDATVGTAGGKFGGLAIQTAFTTNTGFFTGTIGFNGTIIGQGAAVTAIGAGIPFSGQGGQAVGGPITTGRLSVTVTEVVGTTSEMFIREGIDARDSAGNGVVALVTGSVTARDISSGNANRTWITLEIPEPSAILAASAGLFALFGCHRLARRRS